MIFYGVVSAETESVVEFFGTRAEAERMIADVRRDELAERLRVVEVDFGSGDVVE